MDNENVNPGERFKQARNSQPKRVTVREVAEGLKVTENAVRHMELGLSKTLLEKAIAHFGPLWNLPREWFFESSGSTIRESKEERRPYNFGEQIDLPIYVCTLQESKTSWDMQQKPSTRPIRSGFLSGPPHEYFLLVVAGDFYAPRIDHGAIVLVRSIKVVPTGALTFAKLASTSRAIIGVFDHSGKSIESEFQVIGLQDEILGQIEMIHHPTIAGPNLEFNQGSPLMVQKPQAFYQSNS